MGSDEFGATEALARDLQTFANSEGAGSPGFARHIDRYRYAFTQAEGAASPENLALLAAEMHEARKVTPLERGIGLAAGEVNRVVTQESGLDELGSPFARIIVDADEVWRTVLKACVMEQSDELEPKLMRNAKDEVAQFRHRATRAGSLTETVGQAPHRSANPFEELLADFRNVHIVNSADSGCK